MAVAPWRNSWCHFWKIFLPPLLYTDLACPLCRFCAVAHRLFETRRVAVLCALVLLLPTIASGAYKLLSILRAPGDEHMIAAKIPSGASLYVFNAQPVLYLLTQSKPPTPYVLPTILTGNLFSNVAHVNPLLEINRIFQNSPSFVVTGSSSTSGTLQPQSDENPAAYQLAQNWLRADYTEFAFFPDAVVLETQLAGLSRLS